jgi:hypothetical protein
MWFFGKAAFNKNKIHADEVWFDIKTAPKDGTKILLWNGEMHIGFWSKECLRERWSCEEQTGWTTGLRSESCGQDRNYAFVTINNATKWARLSEKPKP